MDLLLSLAESSPNLCPVARKIGPGPLIDVYLLESGLFRVPLDTVVLAMGTGRVLDTGRDTISVDFPAIGYRGIYGALQTVNVRPGQELIRGQIIGTAGPSFRLSIRDSKGARIDPLDVVSWIGVNLWGRDKSGTWENIKP